MKILLLNNRPLNFDQAISLLKVLKMEHPEIFISEFLASAETFRCDLRCKNNDLLIYATALHSHRYFMGPYTFVKVVHNFPESFLKQNPKYSLLEYEEM